MNTPLIVFGVLVCAFVVGAFWFLRDAICEITTSAGAHARTYAVAYVKGSALIALAMLAAFDESFRQLTKETAAGLPWWGWTLLYFKPISAGLAVLVAFLDRSVSRSTENKTSDQPETKEEQPTK